MTILCDYEIKALCTGGMVRNYDEALVNPASLDLRLGDMIMLESAEDLDMRPLSIANATADNPYWLRPGQFILRKPLRYSTCLSTLRVCSSLNPAAHVRVTKICTQVTPIQVGIAAC